MSTQKPSEQTKSRQKQTGVCRGRHYEFDSAELDLRFCDNCEAYVEHKEKNCLCCGVEVILCRGKHHSPHSPELELRYCENCNAYVEYIKKKICYCCGLDTKKEETNIWIRRVLSAGEKQHYNFLFQYSMWPQDVGVVKAKNAKQGKKAKKAEYDYFVRPDSDTMIYIEIAYKTVVYEIPMKYFMKGVEIKNVQMSEDDKKSAYKQISEYLALKGFRIFIPEAESTDIVCRLCNEKKVVSRDDTLYCPKCVQSDLTCSVCNTVKAKKGGRIYCPNCVKAA